MDMSGPPAAKAASHWKTLYALVWLTFLQILVAVPPLSDLFRDIVYAHVALGFGIVFIAHYDRARMKRRALPGRIQRTVRATASLASAQFFLGIYAFLIYALNMSLPGLDVILLLHLVVGLAIFSQASATAMSYDMWEEREFERVEPPTPKA
jgi:hypothetical protein